MTKDAALEVKNNMKNLKEELALLLLHQDTLKTLCENLQPKFESKILRPMPFSKLSMVTANELEKELIPVRKATTDILKARYEFFGYADELAKINIRIDSIKLMWDQYSEHMRQYFQRQAKDITVQMVQSKLEEATKLTKLADEEKITLDELLDQWPEYINKGKEARREFYETVQNFILQHG